MQSYYLYLLDPRGHIAERETVTADDDDRAIAAARRIFAARPELGGFELWERARIVHREAR